MSEEQTKQAVMNILVEAYNLGRDFESHYQGQPGEEKYDGLCDYVAQETERLHTGLMALLAGCDPSVLVLPAQESQSIVAQAAVI